MAVPCPPGTGFVRFKSLTSVTHELPSGPNALSMTRYYEQWAKVEQEGVDFAHSQEYATRPGNLIVVSAGLYIVRARLRGRAYTVYPGSVRGRVEMRTWLDLLTGGYAT